MIRSLVSIALVAIIAPLSANAHSSSPSSSLIENLLPAYADADASLIISTLTQGAYQGRTWNELANFTDTIGPRLCGSAQLEKAVDYMLEALAADGLDNVHKELVALPTWNRGAEFASLLLPRHANLNMLGLGGSVGTQAYGADGLTADVLVVASFDELTARASEAKGKIVVFNQQCDWVAEPVGCYGTSVIYRSISAQRVQAVGGLASLIRSVASFSINSPHTGMINRGSGPQIPTAALTIEDAEMLQRMAHRGTLIRINLKMDGEYLPGPFVGHNVVAEIKGSVYPDEVVIVSGHLDSWDVGQGAMDDGGGAAISWSVLSVIRHLKLQPKRTIRLVMWSCEEFGGIGANQYYQAHASEADKMSMVMESDLGVFRPKGLQFTGGPQAMALLTQIGQLLTSINASAVTTGGEGTDIDPWINVGVPAASLDIDNETYFWYHHSNGDTMTVLNPADVDKCAAVWAVFAYTVANLDTLLPRK